MIKEDVCKFLDISFENFIVYLKILNVFIIFVNVNFIW